MGLNIKSEEAHRLAKRLAEHTGGSLTTAVTTALQERLVRIEANDRIARMNALSKRMAERINAPGGPAMMKIEDLYDEETGLPK